jgi:hypothetical protein
MAGATLRKFNEAGYMAEQQQLQYLYPTIKVGAVLAACVSGLYLGSGLRCLSRQNLGIF